MAVGRGCDEAYLMEKRKKIVQAELIWVSKIGKKNKKK
jgi:hypothetical protein